MAAPKLRFKEFDKAFSRNTIKELAKIYVGRDLVEDAYSPIKTETHIYPIYSNSVDNEGLYGYYNFEEFNFDDDALTVVGRGAGLGKAFYRQGGFGTIGRLLSLTPKDKSFHPKYLSDYINDKLIIHNESGGIPQLPRSSLENYEVVLPSYEEQTKIASFLSAVDEKISQLTEKHALLSQYKQGMMQKLFSQQLHFKADDGSEFGEWEDSKLGELTTLITKGTTPSSLGEKYEESGINFIKIESLSSNGKFLLDKFAYIDENTHNKLARSKLEHDDILFSIAGALGRVAIISRDYLPANTNQALAIIRLKDKKITRYIYYFLNSDYVKKIIDAESVQLAQANFSLGQLANLDVLVPCLEEQTKIANFLSAIDQKIEVVAQQIEQAKQWKKGLLQQMFV